MIENEYRIVLFGLNYSNSSNRNSLLTIQLFRPNYSNNSNSIQKPENERIRIPNSTIRSQLFEYLNNSNNSAQH